MSIEAFTDTRFRDALNRLLQSPEFSSSRQLQDFLRYISERSFEGVAQLDQFEIADAVLGKGSTFNPVEDASVRKLASLSRQRLEQYYLRTGSAEDVVVSLPVRSYVPRYEVRDVSLTQPVAIPPLFPASPGTRRLPLGALLIGLVIGAGMVLLWRGLPIPQPTSPDTFVLKTLAGDISSMGADADPRSVQLGSPLPDGDDLSATLTFTPSKEAQQAGLLVWQDADHYILLGRRFFGRNQLVFTLEEGGTIAPGAISVHYDPEGQSSRPLSLVIHRSGNTYSGFVSFDGLHWQIAGPPLTPVHAFSNPRIGIFAFNGRRQTASIVARFAGLSTGTNFLSDLSGPAAADRFPAGWKDDVQCRESLKITNQEASVRMSFEPGKEHCNAEWTRPIKREDWTLTAKLDLFPLPGVSAGIGLRGSKGAARLARYQLNGPSICLIHDAKLLTGSPDFNGSPAIYLRLQNRRGVLAGYFSADGTSYQPLDRKVNLADLGDNVRAGLRFTINDGREGDGPPPVARFYWWHQSVEHLVPYR